MKKNWYIKEETYSHGDLFELIETSTFYVYKKGKKKPVYTFKGEYYADLEDGIWKKTGAKGVYDLKISDDEKTLTIIFYDKTEQKISLKNE